MTKPFLKFNNVTFAYGSSSDYLFENVSVNIGPGWSAVVGANGANVNAKDKNGATPLHYAARGKGSRVAKILIDKGADVNAKDDRGRTPLDNAAGNGNNETVELLLKHGAEE